MAAGTFAFNVAVPGSGAVVLVEQEGSDGQWGGILVVRAVTVNMLLGGNDQSCLFPVNTTDANPLVLTARASDNFWVKIASGAAPGVLSCIKEIL